MGMKAPIWTFCLVFIWLFMIAGMIVMHVSIGKIQDPVTEFPVNLKKGFLDGFGFSQLRTCANDVMTASTDALSDCGVSCSTKAACQALASNPTGSLSTPYPVVDTSTEKAQINAAFTKGLAAMDKVGNDKYFGVPDFAELSNETGTITEQLALITSPSSCLIQVPAYATMWVSGYELNDLYAKVNAEINKMTTGDEVDTFTDVSKNIKYLHALPWILFLASGIFMVMWWMNGACCCCTNGGMFQSCVLGLPCSILWFVAFVINMIFAGIGWAFTIVLMDQKLTMFKGDPKVGELLGHIKNTFPSFWTITKLAELEDGLSLFRSACTIFVVSSLLIGCYSCCFCCLRPYGTGAKAVEETPESKPAEKQPTFTSV
jgi:hypothetical protein